MTNLLDSILDNMASAGPGPSSGSSGPVILAEENDTSKIDWRTGMADPTEMIKLAQLRGESAEDAGRRAGLARASLDTSTGKVALAVARKAPWHKLGVTVRDAMTWREAFTLAQLDWTVDKMPATWTDAAGNTQPMPGWSALVRSDTGRCFAPCQRFEPVQNRDAFTIMDEALGEFGAHYESAGALYNGEEVFIVASLPKQAFTLAGNDRNLAYAAFTNSHVPGKAGKWFPTSHRIECANTARVAIREAQRSKRGISLSHTGNQKEKLREIRAALGLAVDDLAQFKEAAEHMARTQMSPRHFASDVLDAVLDITAAEALKGADALAAAIATTEAQRELAAKSFAKKIERREEILSDIIERYENQRNAAGPLRGTAWHAYNAVTDHVNYNRIGRQATDAQTWASRRFENVFAGEGDEMIQAAYARAVGAN